MQLNAVLMEESLDTKHRAALGDTTVALCNTDSPYFYPSAELCCYACCSCACGVWIERTEALRLHGVVHGAFATAWLCVLLRPDDGAEASRIAARFSFIEMCVYASSTQVEYTKQCALVQ